ncbi:MAG: metallophosphoesterase, partial [Bacteroidales bacterium]|nr:metallophosphoesterase [Bacteroidales bacterium]
MNAQVDTSYAFIVAGHAYGSHDGANIGLHPALLNSLDSGFDPDVAIFVFTGDIVNHSTSESWQQVEDEMANYALLYYYVMGNHDENDIGQQVFEDKHGGAYYSFFVQHDLFIVLNSTEAGRSISSNQIEFLEDQISQAGDTIRNVFVFFHEILWNSHMKYIGVRSNSRSRYDQMVDYSNYWEEVHPVLMENPGKNFFLFTGDVGGNPDAIAAFYDTWDHITFLSSGMGEVEDENYLLAHIYTRDSVEFELVPLNSNLTLPGIEFYSVPPAPEEITGPLVVPPGGSAVDYSVPEVFNANSYEWELPAGASGTSTSARITLDFDLDFAGGTLSVQAARDG